MRTIDITARAMLCTGAVLSAMTAAPVANAEQPGLNGTFLATSNGEWAQTDDSFRDEATVRSIWTIASTCSNALLCTAHVTSSLGWAADMVYKSNSWSLKHDIVGWQQCPDGTADRGIRFYKFWPEGPDGGVDPTNRTTFVGWDRTTGRSGACGRNRPVEITMPFKLVKLT